MLQWKLKVGLIMLGLVVSAPFARAETTFDGKLTQADGLRSSDSVQFRRLLVDLESYKGKTTALQKQRLKYLQAYEMAVYEDRVDQGIVMARDIFDNTKDADLKYRAGSLVANLAAITRDFKTGLRYLDKSSELRDKVENKAVLHDGIGAAAMFYNEIGQYAIALRHADDMLGDAPSDRSKCAGGLVQIQAKYRLGQLDAPSMSDARSYIDLCTRIREPIPANFLRATLAKKISESGDPKTAIQLLEPALADVLATGYPRLIAEVRAVLADIMLKAGDMESAESNALAAVDVVAETRSSESLVYAYRTLYQLSEARQNAASALDLYKKYAAAEKVYLGDVKARELAYEIVRQETEQKNQQIELLERQNEVLQLEQELDKQSALKARLAMVFLMLVLAAVIYWMLQIKRHQRQLQRLAQTDMLTGVGNRHYFTLKSEKALHEAAREGEQAALVMFDLDHFKAINDTYGHGAGDWVLKQVGRICRTHCRKTDYLGRIGGEEFAIMLRGIDLAEAARIAEDCRSTLAQIDTRESGYSFVVTGSFGVTSTGQSGYDLSRLMSHADQMLYRTKHEGRNRVCVYAPDSPEPKSGRRSTPALTVVGR